MVFDSQFTAHAHLQALHGRGIAFIMLRRRTRKFLRILLAAPSTDPDDYIPVPSHGAEDRVRILRATAKTLFRKLIDMSGQITIFTPTAIQIDLARRRAHNPLLRAAGLADRARRSPGYDKRPS